MEKLYTLLDTENFVLNAQYFEEGTQPTNAVEELVTENFIKTKFDFDTLTFFEGATNEEVTEITILQAKQKETELYKKRQIDGVNAYAEISAEFRLAKLSGVISEAQHGAIESSLIPVRNEVLAGQWISARNILESIGVSIGSELYDRLHTQLTNYINSNY